MQNHIQDQPPTQGGTRSGKTITPSRDRLTVAWGAVDALFPEMRLPFYNGNCSHPAAYWYVPMVGGYDVGYVVGVTMAKCFQRLLSHPEKPVSGAEYLPLIARAMALRAEQANRRSKVAADSLCGQMQGFFSEIGKGAQRDAGDLRLQLLYRSSEAELIAPAIVALSEARAKPAARRAQVTP